MEEWRVVTVVLVVFDNQISSGAGNNNSVDTLTPVSAAASSTQYTGHGLPQVVHNNSSVMLGNVLSSDSVAASRYTRLALVSPVWWGWADQ